MIWSPAEFIWSALLDDWKEPDFPPRPALPEGAPEMATVDLSNTPFQMLSDEFEARHWSPFEIHRNGG